jgi:ornithine carbamoyltransferase
MPELLKQRSLLTLKDFSRDEIRYLLDLSHTVKKEKRQDKRERRFVGKTMALIFEKRSTRTRCAFETAFGEEGGHPVFLSREDIHLGNKESLPDTARVLGRMFDAIQFRGFKQETIETLVKYAGVPVFNGLTDLYHPTQVLADFQAIEEEFGSLEEKKLVYIGDGRNNVANSLMIGSAKMGMHYTVVAPLSLQPDPKLLEYCLETIKENNDEGTINVTASIEEGVQAADALYTDVWISMGEEEKKEERLQLLRPYQVNQQLLEMTGKRETIFLHCLPAVRGNEVTDEVLDGPRSRVWDEAENRKHTIKAVMMAMILGY